MKRLIPILLISGIAHGQTFKDRLPSRLWNMAAGGFAGGRDFIQFHNYGVDGYWGLEGWKGKWQNNDPAQGPAFWGSTTVLVPFTCGAHLMDFGSNLSHSISLEYTPDTRRQGFWKRLGNAAIDWGFHTAGKVLVMTACDKIKNR